MTEEHTKLKVDLAKVLIRARLSGSTFEEIVQAIIDCPIFDYTDEELREHHDEILRVLDGLLDE